MDIRCIFLHGDCQNLLYDFIYPLGCLFIKLPLFTALFRSTFINFKNAIIRNILIKLSYSIQSFKRILYIRAQRCHPVYLQFCKGFQLINN